MNLGRCLQALMLLCGGLSLIVGANNAQASTYRSVYGTTVLVLDESQPPTSAGVSGPATGFYHTQVDGNFVLGHVRVQTVPQSADHSHEQWVGTFSDMTFQPNGVHSECAGQISLQKSSVPVLTLQNPIALYSGDVANVWSVASTWKFISGDGCQESQGLVSLRLKEILPVPSEDGEFAPGQSNTWRSETNGDVTWPVWRVVNFEGASCFANPDGPEVVFTYVNQSRVEAETRGGNALKQSTNGKWFLRTRKNCYVRADTVTLVPLSVPERM